jgi:circadian clock protein KaiB
MTLPPWPGDTTLGQFEHALTELGTARYELTLFVAGASALSAHAVTDVRALCEAHLAGRYDLTVVDVHQDPELVTSRGVLASPTLIKDHPLPKRVLVGSLSDTPRVLVALDIQPVAATAPEPGVGVG